MMPGVGKERIATPEPVREPYSGRLTVVKAVQHEKPHYAQPILVDLIFERGVLMEVSRGYAGERIDLSKPKD